MLKLSLKSYKSTSEQLILRIFSKPVINLLIGSLLGSIFIFLSHFFVARFCPIRQKASSTKTHSLSHSLFLYRSLSFFLSLKSRSRRRRSERGEREAKVNRGKKFPLRVIFCCKTNPTSWENKQACISHNNFTFNPL